MSLSQPTIHPPGLMYAGDNWTIGATLLAADGQPLSLIDVTLQWCLADKGMLNQVIAPENVEIEVVDAPNGAARIKVPKAITERLTTGHYYDALRAVDLDGNVETLWTGLIHVERTGFLATEQESTMEVAARLVATVDVFADAIIA